MKKGFAFLEFLVTIALFTLIGSAVYVFVIAPPQQAPAPIVRKELPQTQPPQTPSKIQVQEQIKQPEIVKPATILPSPQTPPPTVKPPAPPTLSIPPSPPGATVKPPPPSLPPTITSTPIPVFYLEDSGDLIVNREVRFDAIGKKFFSLNVDNYDFIHIFTVNYPTIETPNLFIRARANPAGGLGWIYSENPDPSQFGSSSTGKLQGFSYVGLNLASPDITLYPEDLAFRVLLEEIGHNWGVFIGNEYGEGGLEIREQGAHWWRGLQTVRDFEGIREAGPWKDNGYGTYSLPSNHCTVGQRAISYSPLTLYLMGLADPAEITQSFLLIKSDELLADKCKERVKGTAQRITIGDLIGAAGKRRTITAEASQKNFQMAFAVIYPKGTTVAIQEKSNINWLAENFPLKWAQATSCRSTLNGVTISTERCDNTVFQK